MSKYITHKEAKDDRHDLRNEMTILINKFETYVDKGFKDFRNLLGAHTKDEMIKFDLIIKFLAAVVVLAIGFIAWTVQKDTAQDIAIAEIKIEIKQIPSAAGKAAATEINKLWGITPKK